MHKTPHSSFLVVHDFIPPFLAHFLIADFFVGDEDALLVERRVLSLIPSMSLDIGEGSDSLKKLMVFMPSSKQDLEDVADTFSRSGQWGKKARAAVYSIHPCALRTVCCCKMISTASRVWSEDAPKYGLYQYDGSEYSLVVR